MCISICTHARTHGQHGQHGQPASQPVDETYLENGNAPGRKNVTRRTHSLEIPVKRPAKCQTSSIKDQLTCARPPAWQHACRMWVFRLLGRPVTKPNKIIKTRIVNGIGGSSIRLIGAGAGGGGVGVAVRLGAPRCGQLPIKTPLISK